MATRYWVGGSGTWDATTTTNWSDTSGGAGGASAPTSADDVIFNVNSNVGTGAFTVTFSGTQAAPSACASLTVTGLDGAMTLTGGSGTAWLAVHGSVSFPATNMSISGTGSFVLRGAGSQTLTTNGVSLGTLNLISFTGAGTYTLGSALTLTGSIDWQVGNLDTSSVSNYSISAGTFILQGTATRTINLNASNISLSGTTGNTFNYSGSNVTFNAGTSTINFTSGNTTLNGGGLTFYNVTFSVAGAGTAVVNINGANTYNDLTFTTPSSGLCRIIVGANQTINGTLTLGASNTAIRRVFIFSNVVGTPRTLTVNGSVATLSDVDFRDINAQGTFTRPWTGTRLGNCEGNSNITFPAGTTKYWNLTAGGNWNATAWATSSGGTPSVNNFPLAQDNIIIQNTGLSSGNTITLNFQYNVPTISFATRSNSMTFAASVQVPLYGSLTMSSAVSITGNGPFTFFDQGAHTFTPAGVTFPNVSINNGIGTTQLLGNLTISQTGTFGWFGGGVDLNDFNVTAGIFNANNAVPKTIDFGTTSVINLTGNAATIVAMGGSANNTIIGTAIINCTYSGSTGTRLINLGGNSGNFAINITAGTDIVDFGAGASYYNLDFTGFAGTFNNALASFNIFGNLKLSSGMTVASGTFNITFAATTNKTIQTFGKTLSGVTFAGLLGVGGGSWQLQDSLVVSRLVVLQEGTLDLNNFNITCQGFNSNTSGTRTIAFGTSSVINVNAQTLADGFQLAAGTYAVTGTNPIINLNTGTSSVQKGLINGATNLNINVTGGTDPLKIVTNFLCNNLNFTGYSGVVSYENSGWATLYGSLTLSPTMTLSASTTFNFNFVSESGIKTITTAGQTLNFGLIINNVNGTWEMQDALTLGTNGKLIMYAGRLKLKAGTTNTVQSFETYNAAAKYLESTIAGTQAIISQASGTVTAIYLTIKDSNATGGATWNALDVSNVNAGNNTGWLFTGGVTGNFFLMF